MNKNVKTEDKNVYNFRQLFAWKLSSYRITFFLTLKVLHNEIMLLTNAYYIFKIKKVITIDVLIKLKNVTINIHIHINEFYNFTF